MNLELANQILSLAVREAEVCPECGGKTSLVVTDSKGSSSMKLCYTCEDTGRTAPKTILDLIKEANDDEARL